MSPVLGTWIILFSHRSFFLEEKRLNISELTVLCVIHDALLYDPVQNTLSPSCLGTPADLLDVYRVYDVISFAPTH